MSDSKRFKHSAPFKHKKRTVLNKIPFKRLMFKSIFPILNANKRLNKRLRTPLGTTGVFFYIRYRPYCMVNSESIWRQGLFLTKFLLTKDMSASNQALSGCQQKKWKLNGSEFLSDDIKFYSKSPINIPYRLVLFSQKVVARPRSIWKVLKIWFLVEKYF